MKRTGQVIAYCNADSSSHCQSSTLADVDKLTQLNETSSKHGVWVEIDGLNACERCAKGQGCGLVSIYSASSIRLRCHCDFPVKRSQRVTVAIDEPDSSWLWLVAGAYGLPLLGLVLGVVVAEMIAVWSAEQYLSGGDMLQYRSSAIMNEFNAVLGGVLGLVGGLIAWRHISGRMAAWVQKGLCLHTARIVAVDPRTLENEG